MIRFLITLISFGCLSLVLAQNRTKLRVLDGSTASDTNTNFMVLVLTRIVQRAPNVDPWYMCGGTLIADNLVLTAAHCTSVSNEIIVDVNAYDISDYGQESFRNRMIKVSRVYRHPSAVYGQPRYDLSILELSQPVPLCRNARDASIARLPFDLNGNLLTNLLNYGGNCVTYGWGVIRGDNTANILQQGRFSSVYASSDLLRSNFGASRTCQGDSGGPILCSQNGRQYIVSLNSVMIGPRDVFNNAPTSEVACRAAYYGLNPDLRRYSGWILNTIRNNGYTQRVQDSQRACGF